MGETFQVIVVGAGPAGATTAMLAARAGLNVLLLERGQSAGEKNVSGGLVYSAIYNDVYPKFWERAPVERAIVSHGLVLLGRKSAVSMDHRTQGPGTTGPSANAYSVLRARFDPWFAAQAEAAGATLINGITVESLLTEKGKVVGIQAGPDELRADVVIIAEGSRSLLLKRAGLRDDFDANDVLLGIKEVIRLPTEVINQRFRCPTEQGAALTFVGQIAGVEAGGFIYTNTESLSLGVVVKVSALSRSKRQPHELLEEFKAHAGVAPLIEGGEVVEYAAQTVHRGGLHHMPKLYGEGYLVVGGAAHLLLNNIATLRGMDLAVLSGMVAARTVLAASKRGEYSSASLRNYAESLKQTSAFQDLLTFRRVYPLLDNGRFFSVYPNLVCGVADGLFAVHNTPAKKILSLSRENLGRQVSWWNLLRDGWAVVKGIVA